MNKREADKVTEIGNEVMGTLDMSSFTEEEIEVIQSGVLPQGHVYAEVPCPKCQEVNSIDLSLVNDFDFFCNKCDTDITDPDLETVNIVVANKKVM